MLVAEECAGDCVMSGVSGEELTKIVMDEFADAFATVVQSSDVK